MIVALRALGALLLLALAAALVGPGRLLAQLQAVDPRWFALAVATSIASQATSALRWAAIARVLGLQAPTSLFVITYARGITLNVLVPGATVGGDTLRSVALHRHGNPLAVSVVSVLIDRLSGLWVLCAMSAVAAIAFALAGRLPPGAGALLAPYVLGLCAALALPLLPWRRGGGGSAAGPAAVDGGARASSLAAAGEAGGRATRVTGAATEAAGHLTGAAAASAPGDGLFERLRTRLADVHALLVERRTALLRSLWGSILVQLGAAGALWLCLLAAGGDAGFLAVLAVSAPVFIAAALPVSLGGFGTREVAAAAVFPLVGIAGDAGVAAAVLYGLTAVVIGLLAAPLFAVRALRAG